MRNTIADAFTSGIEEIEAALYTVPEAHAVIPWRTGGWTRQVILGHMLDSAANNHQRFVRAAIGGSYEGPTYDQQAWVEAHGYENQPWQRLLAWWTSAHQMLVAVVEQIPEERLAAVCLVEGEQSIALRSLIEHYVEHQQHHLRQIAAQIE